MIKKVIILICIIQSLAYSNSFNYSLADYVAFASRDNKVQILISDSIDSAYFDFYTDKENPTVTIEMLKSLLNSQGLNLLKFDDYYFVDFKVEDENVLNLASGDLNLYTISLKNRTNEEVLSLLKLFDINATYISNTNQIYFTAKDDEIYNKIISSVKNIDKEPKQLQIKITIFETNLNEIKDRGSEISSYIKSLPGKSYNYFVNLVTMPYNATTNITSTSKGGFYNVLNFLDNNGFTNIKSSPFFMIRNAKELNFSSVENIPYLVQHKEFKDNEQSVTNSYEYRDVGLKVQIFPYILDNGSVDLDLSLTVENLLNNYDNKPTISRKYLKSSYVLNRGELLILSGLNQTLNFKDEFKVPLLSDLWFIGWLFKYEKTQQKETNLTMSIEIL